MIFRWFKGRDKYKKSPTEIIESDKSPWKEQYFIKAMGKELKECSKYRFEDAVSPNLRKLKKYFKKNGKKSLIELHTHPGKSGESFYRARPSSPDINSFMMEKNLRTSIIARQDPTTGKVLGYTILMKTDKSPKSSYTKYENKISESKEDFLKKNPSLGLSAVTSSSLKEISKVVGFKYRHVPVKGYKFDRWVGDFIPVKKSNLEKKIITTIAIGSLSVSILLMSRTITGLAITNFSFNNPTFIGITLFMFGIGLLYFYYKKS